VSYKNPVEKKLLTQGAPRIKNQIVQLKNLVWQIVQNSAVYPNQTFADPIAQNHVVPRKTAFKKCVLIR
jgi:hypothetical protein